MRPIERPRRAIAKAVTWRLLGSIDTFVLSFLVLNFAGSVTGADATPLESAAVGGSIAATEAVTKVMLYYAHERAWARFAFGLNGGGTQGARERWRRSLAKTATWRGLASLDTFVLALVFTGNATAALTIGGLEVVSKLGLYYVHERVWNRVAWSAPLASDGIGSGGAA